MSVQCYINHMDGGDLLEIVHGGTVMFEGSLNEYDNSLDKFPLTHNTSKVIHHNFRYTILHILYI